MSRSKILAVSSQQRPSLTKWGYAESTQKHPFHSHHQPFWRTMTIFWARAPPAITSQSRSLFLEFSTFSRSCSNLISFLTVPHVPQQLIIQCLFKVQNTQRHFHQALEIHLFHVIETTSQTFMDVTGFELRNSCWGVCQDNLAFSNPHCYWFVFNDLKSDFFFTSRTDFDFEMWQ